MLDQLHSWNTLMGIYQTWKWPITAFRSQTDVFWWQNLKSVCILLLTNKQQVSKCVAAGDISAAGLCWLLVRHRAILWLCVCSGVECMHSFPGEVLVALLPLWLSWLSILELRLPWEKDRLNMNDVRGGRLLVRAHTLREAVAYWCNSNTLTHTEVEREREWEEERWLVDSRLQNLPSGCQMRAKTNAEDAC